MNRDELAYALTALGLVALTLVVWLGCLDGPFVYDDKIEVIGNRTIRWLDDWEAIIAYNRARMVLIFSYAVNFRVGGFDPTSYHLVDVAIQAVNAALAAYVGWGLARSSAVPPQEALPIGAFGAALWTAHPLLSEAVCYVTGRSEQLMAAFALAGLAYAVAWNDRRAEGQGAWGLWAGLWCCFILSALCKESAVVFPLALVAIEGLIWQKGNWRAARWPLLLPGLLLTSGVIAGRLLWLGWTAEVERPLHQQVLTEAEVTLRYIQLSLIPWGQTLFHDHPVTGLTLRSGLAAVVCLGLLGWAGWMSSRKPLVGFGVLWFFLWLAPSSSVVPLKETMAEHRVYLSLLGLCWAASAALGSSRRTWGVGAVLVLMGLSLARVRVWDSEVALWAEATVRSSHSSEAWYGYGDALRFAGQAPEAAIAYQQAVALDPAYLDAWANLGMVKALVGRDEEAMDAWNEALSQKPTYCKAHNNIGLLHARRNRPSEALAAFNTAMLYCPDNPDTHYLMGMLYQDLFQDPEKAIAHYQRCLELDDTRAYTDDARARLLQLTF